MQIGKQYTLPNTKTMKQLLTIALLLSVTTWLSCTPDKKTEETEIAEEVTTQEQEATTTETDTTLTDSKKELMQTLAQFGMMQVELGKLASEKGTSNEVKQNGREMTQLYTTKQKELQELAQTYNLTLNTTLNEDHRKHLEDLKQEKPVNFDKKYWEALTSAQKETLGDYEDVLKDITEADTTGFGIWARTSEKELRAQYEQALAQQQQQKNNL